MIKKLFPFLSVIMLALFIGACNSEDVMPNIDQGASSRTVTFEGYMPTTTPSTRVVETPDGDRGYKYTWEVDDKLQLLFEQEAVEKTGVATVVAVDAKTGKGTFTLTLPEGIDGTKNYKLYGVINIDSNEYDTPSSNPSHIGILEDDLFVVFYFNKEVVNNEIGTVTFEHKTSIIEVEIKVTDASFDIGTLENIQLIGDDSSNTEWAYEYSGNYFDLKQGKFTDNNARTNSISYNDDGAPHDRVLYGFFPIVDALGDTNWPALKLSFSDGTNTYTTVDAKPARTPENGNNYYIYATFDGTDLVFTDKEFETGTKISIADLRENYVADAVYAEDHYIEGEVILNGEHGNANTRAAFIADGTAGVSFFFAEEAVAAVPLGAKVKVNLLNASWSEFNGLIQLNMSVDGVEILEATATTPLEPRVVTIQDLLDGKHQSDLVQINDVQFKNIPATYGNNPDLIDSNSKEINVRSSGSATFKDESVPEGNGAFIGVVGIFYNPQLLVRETADLAGMTGPRYVPPFINVNPFSLTFEKEAGSETIAVTSNVAWTATSDATWATISPASGTNDGTITVSVEANTAAEARSAVITITDDDDATTTTVNVTQAGAEEDPVTLLFPGSDFNNWDTFLSSLTSTTLKSYAKESETGGRDSSGAMHLEGKPGGNDYVFTAKVPAGFSTTGKTKITFWIKGTSDTKSLSLNVYGPTGQNGEYQCYNLGETSSAKVVDPSMNNSYGGAIDTGGEWIKISLDISTIVGEIITTPGESLFALKVGRDATYNLYIDDITIE